MSSLITTSAHDVGYTCLTFSKDGQRAFTGGHDCIVRIWKMDEGAEQEPDAAAEAEGGVTCVAATDDCWLSSSEDTEVRRYSKDSIQFDAPLTTTNGVPVRSIAIDPKGRRVAVASDELSVKVIDMEDIKNVQRLEGYKSGVRNVTWNPTGSLLASCTCDGKIIIWNMSVEPPVVEKTIEGMIPIVDDSESQEFSYDCSVIWHNSGDHFYIANRGHEIIQVDRSTWTRTATFADKNVTGAITALALSSNGTYLVSASQSTAYVWSTKTRSLVTQQLGNAGSIITKIAFSPKDNLIAWADSDGVFTRWPKPISDKLPDPVKIVGLSSKPDALSNADLDLFLESGSVVAGNDNLGDVDLDEDMADADDGWIDDDMDGAFHKEPETIRTAGDGFVKEMVSITKAQPPFQPGSTPMENKRRYLAYNMIGVIEVTDQDVHHIVNVEVFDHTLRKGFHFQDSYKCDLGYLGERGLLLACPPDADHPAEVKFRTYTTWNPYEWTYTLTRKGSRCLGIAAGSLPLSGDTRNSSDSELQGYGNIVVATSENDLTFLSGSGRERRIMGLGGDFVTMVAGAEWVFVVYRAGSTTIDGSQNLSYCIINFEDFSVRQRDILPVPKGHTLKWVGLTNHGAPAMFDSSGYVHILTKYRVPHHASWARVMDTNLLERRQGKDESYWPVGITDSTFMCLILKGRQEHPGFPKPLMQELPMQLPFRRPEEKEEQIERELLQISILLDSLDEELTTDDIVAREKAMDKEFIQLIQAACKNNNIPRAIELTKLLHHTASIDVAMKVADFYRLPGLKEKVGIIKADREQAEDRLIVARNKRRRWLKPEPPLRQLGGPSSTTRFDPLGDTRPPPPIERPGMARVTVPVIETSRYSSLAPRTQTPEPEPVTWHDSPTQQTPPPSTDGKRKRTEVDDMTSMPDLPIPPPKQKTNPFARKPGQEANKNPFARKVDSNKPLQKSESFFDKVEVAESEPPKKRNAFKKKDNQKDKKDGQKQATLFGMLPKTDKSTKPVKKAEEQQVEETQIETQVTDINMSDGDVLADFETQEDETQIPSAG